MLAHDVVGPVMAPGVAGNNEMVNANDDVVPVLHPVIGVTVMEPVVTVVVIVTVILLVLAPAVMVDPDGTVHVYPVAFVTAGTV